MVRSALANLFNEEEHDFLVLDEVPAGSEGVCVRVPPFVGERVHLRMSLGGGTGVINAVSADDFVVVTRDSNGTEMLNGTEVSGHYSEMSPIPD